jgi:hypothetical protein
MSGKFLASNCVFVVHCFTRRRQFLSTSFLTLLWGVEKSWWKLEVKFWSSLLWVYFSLFLSKRVISTFFSSLSYLVLWLLLGYILYLCGAPSEAYIVSPHLAKFIKHRGTPLFGFILGFHELEVFVASRLGVWFYLLSPRCPHGLLTLKS